MDTSSISPTEASNADLDILWSWNREVPSARQECVHDLISATARKQPDAIAVDAADGRLTYRELDALSTNLARHLAHLLQPGSIVPLCFEKSLFTTVTALAILKAGCAFLLLDTAQPVERLCNIVEQTDATVVCASSNSQTLGERLTNGGARLVVLAHGCEALSESQNAAELQTHSDPESTCYCVFTSGSTGNPKGITVSHSSICTALHLQLEHLEFGPEQKVFDFASYSFDVSVHNLLATLVSGACLCIPDNAGRLQDPTAEMARMGVTLANLTPSIARLLEPERVPTLRTLIFLGEALAKHDVDRWPASIRVVPTYGPAECTPISTINLAVSSLQSSSQSGVSIGTGVGVTSWVVDPEDHNTLLPIGAVGELLLEGPLLSGGYLGDVSKTSEAFIESPRWLRSTRSSRLYKTGDLVRYERDGSLLFAGRKDTQVKIHGVRVELGEIESVLHACFGGTTQIAADIIGSPEKPTLAAFLQGAMECSSVVQFRPDSEIRDQISRRLPVYMIPTVFFSAPELPYTASAKLDRRRLRQMASSAPGLTETAGTRTHVMSIAERKLSELWAEVLGIHQDRIEPDQTFLSLGGDSLLAIRLVGAARNAGITLRVTELLRAVTLRDMAGSAIFSSDPVLAPHLAPFSLLGTENLVPQLASACGVRAKHVEDAYPCTPLQEGLLSLTARDSADYWLNIRLDISHLDQAAFKNAWQRTVHAIPALRTRIVQTASSSLIQVVLSDEISWCDVTDDRECAQDQHKDIILGQHLLRFASKKDQDQSTIFEAELHHAIADAWSLDIIIDTMRKAYTNGSIDLPALRFNQFVRYTQSVKSSGDWQAYWTEYLTGHEAVPFPNRRMTPTAGADHETLEKVFPLSANSADATPTILIRAALATVISQHTRSDDVVFGTTLAGRNAPIPGIEKIAGPTITTVPLRVRLDRSDMTVRDYIHAVGAQAIAMVPYEHTGLQHIARLNDAARQACDFQTLLVVQPFEDGSDADDFGHVETLAETLTTYALTLECFLRPGTVRMNARYDENAVGSWQLERFLDQLGFVLAQLTDERVQTKPMRDLDYVPPDEKALIWSRNAAVPPTISKTPVQLIRDQARAQGATHPAVHAWDGDLSFQELDHVSDRLAGHLASIGVSRGMLVPLCFSKTAWVVCAMLGVLKAGASFVPLEPSMPRNRRQTILDGLNASTVVVSEAHASLFTDNALQVVTVSSDLLHSLPERSPVGHCHPDPSDVAYVIFTSGSTGRPKGVELQHSAVSSSCVHHGTTLGFSAFTRHLQFSSYTFDGCVTEIFTTLIFGGCVCIPSDSDRMSDLTRVINDLDINAMFLSTAVTRIIDPVEVPGIAMIAFGGEVNTRMDYARWQAPGRRVFGVYGPTECCVYCAVHDSRESMEDGLIGRSMSSVGWVVDADDHTKLAPVASVGELVVEGPTLARGYLNDPEKTAASFVESPPWLRQGCAGIPGRQSRLYKTGDLVQYTAMGDGILRYIGRKDKQVKINGQRLELSEVEHHIRQAMPEARAALAEIIPATEGLSTDILAAFVHLGREPGKLSVEDEKSHTTIAVLSAPRQIADHMAACLPAHMNPRLYFAVHGDLPHMTSSTKIDRSRLRQLGADLYKQHLKTQQHNDEKVQPRTAAERRLQRLWGSVLAIDDLLRISLNDNFFSLGGDSILAMKLADAARKDGWLLTVANIFTVPRLVEQAAALNRRDETTLDEVVTPFSLLHISGSLSTLLDDLARLCAPSVDPKSIEDAYPCTALQEGLISLSLKRPGDYVAQHVMELAGDMNTCSLEMAWREAADKMPILRTRIVQHSQVGFLQVVCGDGIPWTRGTSLQDCLQAEKDAVMALGATLARTALTNDQPPKLILTIHHALYDGVSLKLLMQAVDERLRGASPIPSPPPFQRFIKHMLSLNGPDVESYWRSTLQGDDINTFPSLPSAIPEPVADSATHIDVRFSGDGTEHGHREITMSSIIRAALGLTLARYTNSNDVVFGATLSGRNAAVEGVTEMIAPTIATVPVRMRVDTHGETSIRQYLQETQRSATEMIPHQFLGLQNISQLGNEQHHACQFQTLLVVQADEDDGWAQEQVAGKWMASKDQSGFATYAITLECFLRRGGLRIKSRFDSRIIDHWKMGHFLNQLSHTIQQLANYQDRPEQMITELSALPENDRTLLRDWNATPLRPAVNRCIHDMIKEQAGLRPTSLALDCWDGQLTYAQLDGFSDRMGQHLMELGVKPEMIVPLCFPKSVWTPVAMLAVLKAGGAFLLLDPSHPAERLRALCERCQARIAVAAPSTASQIDDFVKDTVVFDQHTADEDLPLSGVPSHSVNPSHSAYIIFTSGSTGLPKGCVVEHRSYCSTSINHGPVMGVNEQTRTLQYGSYGFAVAIMEILQTLILGACVCVPSDEQRSVDIERVVREYRPNWAYLTSTVLDQLHPEGVPSLHTIVIGGEAIRTGHIAQWSRNVHLRQAYGSAETAAVVSSCHISPASSISDVGRPTTGRYWLVDPKDIGRLAVIASPGEIIIEGPTIGREYFKDPEKTAAAFIQPPQWRHTFGPLDAGSRFYRTGDLAVYRSDGSIQLLGRKDTQVKLRGQRIELGEIEQQARDAVQQIKECAVELVKPKASQASSTDAVLACFMTLEGASFDAKDTYTMGRLCVVLDAQVRAVTNTLRSALQSTLPRFMIPSTLLVLVEMPKTSSKKIERKMLREAIASTHREEILKMTPSTSSLKRAPTTVKEEKLQLIWSRVLGTSAGSIGVDDDLFQLGGHSVLAVKVVSEAGRAGYSLSMASVFEKPTIAGQAAAMVEAPAESFAMRPFALLGMTGNELQHLRQAVAANCSSRPSNVEDVYPSTPLQEGILSLAQKAPEDGLYVLQHVLELSDNVRTSDFRAAWESTYATTPILRTRIVQHENRLLQIVVKEPIEWHEAATANLSTYLDMDKRRPMNLARPLCRFALVGTRNIVNGSDRTVPRWFVWTVHHAIYDAVSLSLIIDSVKAAYAHQRQPPRKGFSSFIRHLAAADTQAADEHWRSTLENSNPASFPPLRTSRSTATKEDYGTLETICQLPSASPLGFTSSTVIRASVALLMARHTSNDDTIFGEVLSGRNASISGIEETVGPTITTVPVRSRLNHGDTVPDYLAAMHCQIVDRIPFEQTGLQRIAQINSRATDFQTLLVIESGQYQTPTNEAFGTWVTDAEQAGFETYALTLTCTLPTVKCNEVCLKARFDSEILSSWSANQLLDQLSYIIQQMMRSEPHTPLSSISLLTPSARQALWDKNAEVPETVHCTIPQLFAQRVASQPNSIAVESWDCELTYTELDMFSDRLARHLLDAGGANKGCFVPLIFEKSAFTVVAMMGVMKAGGASVTMDVTQPAERLRSTVDHLDACVVICSVSNEYLAKQLLPGRPVFVVSKENLLGLDTSDIALPAPSPNDNVCVVFTSGSTGKPKGAMLTHSGFATAIKYQARTFGHGPGARIFSFASYSFDISWFDTLHALASGSCLFIPSESERKDDVEGALAHSRATSAFLTPTVARLLRAQALPCLRYLALGGEPQRWSDFAFWPESVTKVSVYGPAECTVVSSAEDARILKSRDMTLPNGLGLNVWLVDPDNVDNLSPLGMVGEIVLEGPLVGNGYINNVDQTAFAFIRDPAWLLQGDETHPGRHSRLYKTGDLARYTSDGRMEFAGRKDTQVKIRGQRVELVEVEMQVERGLPGAKLVVAEMVTMAGEHQTPVLAVFVEQTLDPEQVVNVQDAILALDAENVHLMQAPADLLEALGRSLPSYMVPQVFFSVQSMPRTANGKTDRKRLRAIASCVSAQQLVTLLGSESPKRQPENAVASQLQKLWANTLSVQTPSIGIEDNFFQLGGDSVAAMKMVGQARKQGLTSLTVAEIFHNPTIESQSRLQVQNGDILESTTYSPPPFSLLGPSVDVQALRSRLTETYKLRSGIRDIYYCTPLQEGLLSLTSRRTGDYVMQNVLELPDSDDFNLPAFKEAWEETFQTFQVLRTRMLEDVDLGLLQVQLKSEWLHWQTRTTKSLEQYLRDDKTLPMAAGELLCRFALIPEVGAEKPRWFVLTLHHSVYDGWSLQTIMRKAVNTFSATVGLLKDAESPTGPITSFARFVKYVKEQDKAAGEEYWKTALVNSKPVTFPATSLSPLRSASIEAVRHDFAMEHTSGFTTSTIMRAALAMLISRNTQAPEATFGATVSGRTAPLNGIDAIVGPTVATVPLRIHTEASTTIRSLLTAVQQQSIEMISYEQAGIQNIAKLSDDARAACAFQTLLVVQPEEETDDDMPLSRPEFGTWCTPSDQVGFSTYPFVVECVPKGARIQLQAHHDSGVLDKWLAERLLNQLAHYAQHLVQAQPGNMLSDVSRMPAEDRDTVWQWNTSKSQPTERCMHDFLDDQAAEQPNAQAVCAWDGEMTYRELQDISARLAVELRGMGAGTGTIVPLLFEKSIWAAPALFAVARTGAAFALIDVTSPEARISTIVQQAQASVVCCSREQKPLAQRLGMRHVIVGPEGRSPLEAKEPVNLPQVDPATPAYLVFTSGSTGTPKGAMVPHASFASATESQRKPLNLSRESRVYDFASYSFDVAVHNIVSTVAAGGCVCVPSDTARKSRLEESINELGANYASLTASVADLIDPAQIPGLKTLTFLGEPVRHESAERWWGSDVRLITSYGPAESTPTSTVNDFAETPGDLASIGKGCGAVTWIVDSEDHNQLMPLGEIGELLLEGPLLGSGYLNDEQKTNAAFVTDPSWLLKGSPSCPGRSSRLYKTGDLVCYNADGSLRIVGRKDTQVKIRGQRVELGEVESCLRELIDDAERKVVVDAIEPSDMGTTTLAAFICYPDGDQDDSPSTLLLREAAIEQLAIVIADLSAKISQRLPSYMVPSLYIPITRIPLTATGKIDRRQLRQLGSTLSTQQLQVLRGSSSSSSKIPPSSDTERRLAGVWASLLHISVDDISREDNFFTLGGDSITAMRLVAEARRLGWRFSVMDVFERPTVAGLVETLRGSLEDEALVEDSMESNLAAGVTYEPFSLVDSTNMDSVLETLQRSNSGSVDDILPTTDFQTQSIRHGLEVPMSAFNYFFLDLGKDVDNAKLRQACETLIDRFALLRRAFVQANGKIWQAVLRKVALPFQDSMLGAEQDLASASDSICLQDMNEDSLQLPQVPTKAILVRSQTQGIRLIVRLSHAQYDGISLALMLETLSALYNGHEVPNEDRSFSTYLAHQVTERERSIQHWRQLLQGSRPATIVDSLSTRPKDPPPRRVEAESSIDLSSLPDAHKSSIASLIGAAWAIVLAATTGRDDVIFGHLVSGRENSRIPGIDRIPGPCVTIIPMRIAISRSSTTWVEVLQAVQRQHFFLAENTALMGAEDIIRTCTDWEDGETLESVVQHQNIDEHPSFRFGDIEAQLQWHDHVGRVPATLGVVSRFEEGKLRIQVVGSSHQIDAAVAERLVGCLRDVVEAIVADMHGVVDGDLVERVRVKLAEEGCS